MTAELVENIEWDQCGTFFDVDGSNVKVYDDVIVLEKSIGTDGEVITEGEIGTVLFFSKSSQSLVELEICRNDDEMIFLIIRGNSVRLHKTTEEKWPDKNVRN